VQREARRRTDGRRGGRERVGVNVGELELRVGDRRVRVRRVTGGRERIEIDPAVGARVQRVAREDARRPVDPVERPRDVDRRRRRAPQRHRRVEEAPERVARVRADPPDQVDSVERPLRGRIRVARVEARRHPAHHDGDPVGRRERRELDHSLQHEVHPAPRQASDRRAQHAQRVDAYVRGRRLHQHADTREPPLDRVPPPGERAADAQRAQRCVTHQQSELGRRRGHLGRRVSRRERLRERGRAVAVVDQRGLDAAQANARDLGGRAGREERARERQEIVLDDEPVHREHARAARILDGRAAELEAPQPDVAQVLDPHRAQDAVGGHLARAPGDLAAGGRQIEVERKRDQDREHEDETEPDRARERAQRPPEPRRRANLGRRTRRLSALGGARPPRAIAGRMGAPALAGGLPLVRRLRGGRRPRPLTGRSAALRRYRTVRRAHAHPALQVEGLRGPNGSNEWGLGRGRARPVGCHSAGESLSAGRERRRQSSGRVRLRVRRERASGWHALREHVTGTSARCPPEASSRWPRLGHPPCPKERRMQRLDAFVLGTGLALVVAGLTDRASRRPSCLSSR
jgi:hypothetical protein